MLRIGALARRASVTVRTLRFYDHAGVFRPARVDPRTGYRYYEAGQLADLEQLRLLRALGAGICDLKAWAHSGPGSEERAALLMRLHVRLEARLTEDLDRLRTLELWLAGDSRPPSDVDHSAPVERVIPPIPAFTIRERVRSPGRAVYRLFESAERSVARHAVRSTRGPFLLFHAGDYRGGRADVEVCVPVSRASLGVPGVRLVEGADRAACLEFSGSYAQGPAIYDAIRRWMDRTGARPEGPVRETYLRFGADQRGYALPRRLVARDVADYRTELDVPISTA